MSLAVIKNKTEEAIAAEIAARAAHLPGGSDVRKARDEAAAKFNASGLPHRRIEEWKYTDLRALLKGEGATGATPANAVEKLVASALPGVEAETYVFVDGKLTSKPKGKTQSGLTIASLADHLATNDKALNGDLPATVDQGASSIITLNAALVSDGAMIDVAANASVSTPVHLVFIATGTVAVRNKISLAAGSSATIIETHISPSTCREFSVTDIELGDDATLYHITNSETVAGSYLMLQTLVETKKGASYRPFQFQRGSGVSRQQVTLTLAGENSSIDFSSAALIRDAGHGDTTLVIDHAVPHCTSRELFKTVLDNTARGIFQGKVIVRPDAQKTDGKQMAQALMLSPDAEFDSKPELEIYADDVVCGHGTTSAEIDDDMLFYCKSRGIPEIEARALLIESFIGEAIDKVENEQIRVSFMTMARAWLGAAHT